MVLAAFLWANARRAFGGCVRLGTGGSREAAKARRGAKGMGEVLDMINMIYMIFVGLWVGLGLR